MLQFSRKILSYTEIFKPLSEVCLACRTSQVVCRRTFLKKASKEQKKEDKSKRKQERRELVAEITKGYFSDLREFGQSGGKRFFAAEKIIDPEDAVTFPELNARNLHKRDVKLNEEFSDSVTLVLMWLRAIGQNMCVKYRQHFMDNFRQHPNVKCFEINVVDGVFFKLMKPFIQKSLKQQISAEKQDRYLCYYGNSKSIKDTLIENEIVGHAFLVDRTGKVRWKAHGRPTQEEIEFMVQCTEELLRENAKSLNQKYQR